LQEKTGTAGVLVARAAMWNPSVFNKDGPRHVFEVVKRYCKLCLEYDFALEVMKYNVLSMLRNEFSRLENRIMSSIRLYVSNFNPGIFRTKIRVVWLPNLLFLQKRSQNAGV